MDLDSIDTSERTQLPRFFYLSIKLIHRCRQSFFQRYLPIIYPHIFAEYPLSWQIPWE